MRLASGTQKDQNDTIVNDLTFWFVLKLMVVDWDFITRLQDR
jgi:hypothetical protein